MPLRRAIVPEHVVGLAEPEGGDDLEHVVAQGPAGLLRALGRADGRGLLAQRVVRLGEVRGDPPEPAAVAERLGLPGRAGQMIEGAGELAERGERGPQVEDEIDGRLEDLERLLEADGPRGPALDRGIAFSREMDLTAWLPMLLCARGAAQVRSGRVGDGLLLLEEGVHRASALRILSRHALRLAWLAEGYLLAGHGDRAADAADQAHRLAAEHAEQGYAAMAVRMLGETAARAGQGTRAAEHYADALARARALEMRPLEALCRLGLGELARGAGDGTAAKERLTEAVGLLREMDMRYWLLQAESALRGV